MLLTINNIDHYYHEFHALKDISFNIDQKEIIAFIGPNGAGKTTTLRILSGYMPPTKGNISFLGKNFFENALECKKMIGYLPENPPLYPELTVLEFLHFIAQIKQVPKEKISKRVDFAIEMVKLEERRNALISQLSKGLKQRVSIAQSILGLPKLLLLDEPTSGLEPQQIIDFRKMVSFLSDEYDMSIFLSTHLLREAEEICQKAIIIKDGKIIATDSIKNLEKNITEKHIIHVILQNGLSSTEILNYLKEDYILNIKETNPKEYDFYLQEDKRTTLSKNLAQNHGLLLFSEQKENLEDVFTSFIS